MNDYKTDILNYLKSHGVLTLGVLNKQSPWVCTLYYGIDDNFNIYVVTDSGSIHGLALKENQKVAFNVFDSHTKITESKVGVQAEGTCEMVTNPMEIVKGLSLWHKFNPGIETKITVEDIKKLPDTKLYKIKPTFLKIFDKKTYGGDGYKEVNC